MINLSTFEFLENIARHNHRDWFKQHRVQYDNAYANVLDFTAEVIRGLSVKDVAISQELDPKTCIMRIYRDVRFSKDKSPYKTNFGIAISPNGKNFSGPGYYLHIEPGKSFVAGGSWYPESSYLKSIRQEIDYNAGEWRQIIENPEFKETFGDLDQEAKLQTTPKGYNADHPEIAYLKLKSFTVSKSISDQALCSDSSAGLVTTLFGKLYPFMLFLRNANS